MPTLKARDRVYKEDSDKAALLLQTFFPLQPELQGEEETREVAETDFSNLIGSQMPEEEVERAIFKSNLRKAPRPNGLSFQVWQEL